MNDLLDEIDTRKEKYKIIRYSSWCGGLIFALLIVDFLFFRRTYLNSVFEVSDPVKLYLLVGWISYNLYFYFDFMTDKLGHWPNLSFTTKFGIMGFNIVCLGHILGFINV